MRRTIVPDPNSKMRLDSCEFLGSTAVGRENSSGILTHGIERFDVERMYKEETMRNREISFNSGATANRNIEGSPQPDLSHCGKYYPSTVFRSLQRVATTALGASPRTFVAFLLLGLFSATTASAKQFTILTEPVVDGRVFVDGNFVGVAPVTVDIKVRKKRPAEVTVEKEGAEMEKSQLVTSTQQERIVVRLIPTSREYTIVTEPVSGGNIFIDGEFAGVAPLSVHLSVTKGEPIVITTEKTDTINRWRRNVSPSLADKNTTIVVRLEEDRAYLETEESANCGKWITVTPRRAINSSVDTNSTWQKLISLITDSFPDLQQLDPVSYYIRTAWRIRDYPYNVLRHRLIVRRGVGDDLTLRIFTECQIAPVADGTYRDEDFRVFRRLFPIDSETIDMIGAQL